MPEGGGSRGYRLTHMRDLLQTYAAQMDFVRKVGLEIAAAAMAAGKRTRAQSEGTTVAGAGLDSGGRRRA